jgi:hypothetical protein
MFGIRYECFCEFKGEMFLLASLAAQSLGNGAYHIRYNSSPVPRDKSFHLEEVPKRNMNFFAQGGPSDGAKRHKNLKRSQLST